MEQVLTREVKTKSQRWWNRRAVKEQGRHVGFFKNVIMVISGFKVFMKCWKGQVESVQEDQICLILLSTRDSKWQSSSGLRKGGAFVRFCSFDGGCRVKYGAGFLSGINGRSSGFKDVALMLVYFIPHQKHNLPRFHLSVSQQSKYIYFSNWHRKSPWFVLHL